jgi:hypothetical protein
LIVVWLRQCPTQEILTFLFGMSDPAAKRAIDTCLPLLERAGPDTVRMPNPGRGSGGACPG